MNDTITISIDEFKKLKFALAFAAGGHRSRVSALANSSRSASRDRAKRLQSLAYVVDAVTEKYAADVDLEAILENPTPEWGKILPAVK